MKLSISSEWLARKLDGDRAAGVEEPGGLMACNPDLYAASGASSAAPEDQAVVALHYALTGQRLEREPAASPAADGGEP